MRILPILSCLLMASCSLTDKGKDTHKFTIFEAPREFAEKPSAAAGSSRTDPALPGESKPSEQLLGGDLRIPNVLEQMPAESDFRGSNTPPKPGENPGIIVKPPKE